MRESTPSEKYESPPVDDIFSDAIADVFTATSRLRATSIGRAGIFGRSVRWSRSAPCRPRRGTLSPSLPLASLLGAYAARALAETSPEQTVEVGDVGETGIHGDVADPPPACVRLRQQGKGSLQPQLAHSRSERRS